MSEDHRDIRQLLGAYLLGGLEPADRDRFETHLSTCTQCRDELSQSASLPSLLRRVDRAVQLPPDELTTTSNVQLRSLSRLLGELRVRRRRSRILTGVAVAAAFIAAALVITPALLHPPDTATFSVVELRPARGTATSQATLDVRPWGTAVTLTATGLPGTGPFTLEVTSRSGEHERAASWGSTPTGRARVVGATSLPPSGISQIRIFGPGGLIAQSP